MPKFGFTSGEPEPAYSLPEDARRDAIDAYDVILHTMEDQITVGPNITTQYLFYTSYGTMFIKLGFFKVPIRPNDPLGDFVPFEYPASADDRFDKSKVDFFHYAFVAPNFAYSPINEIPIDHSTNHGLLETYDVIGEIMNRYILCLQSPLVDAGNVIVDAQWDWDEVRNHRYLQNYFNNVKRLALQDINYMLDRLLTMYTDLSMYQEDNDIL